MSHQSRELKKAYKDAAINRIDAEVSRFLYANPDHVGNVNLAVITHQTESDFIRASDDQLQRLTMNDICLKALSHEKVLCDARERVLNSHRRVKEINFDISKHHANINVLLVKP